MSEIKPFCYLKQTSSERNPPHGWAVHFGEGEVPLYTTAAIESLQAECERVRAELAAAQSTIKLQEGMLDDRDALAEKLDAAEIDAERYRWLTSAPPHSVRWQRVRLEWFSSHGGWNPVVGLDATIDAAMAKEKRDE